MRLSAPAKINLHLRVGPPTLAGFHPLLSWMCTVALFDMLQMQLEPTARSLIEFTCDDARIPSDHTNLVMRGGELVADAIAATREGAALPSVRVHLQKKIATGAGLGGGSSDAARAMSGFDALWKGKLGRSVLADLSSRCGSDIPFFFFGSSSICTGRGEVVRSALPPRRARWSMLIFPQIMMPTPAVYRKFDELELGCEQNLVNEPDWLQWSELPANKLLPLLVNDLEPAAFAIRPDLAGIRESAEQWLGRPVRMSGSGSTLFTLFDEQLQAERAAAALQERFVLQTMAMQVAPSLEDDLPS